MNDDTVRIAWLPDLGNVPKVFHVYIKSGASIQPTTGGDAVNQATPVHNQSYNESLSAQRLSL
jgi:hypothetical protein